MRYFILLSYDGTNYHGWQRQPKDTSVQECIEIALEKFLGKYTPVVGAGRTDSGVHARMMIAHFDVDFAIDCKQICFKLNTMLPPSIGIYDIKEVHTDAHARFSAKTRTYHYYISLDKYPFDFLYSSRIFYNLDFELMNQAAKILKTYNDFGCFCKAHSDNKTNICKIFEATWIQDSPTRWHFRIKADRFLRNMVRAIVGTLFEVGRGKITINEFSQIIEQGNRSLAGESVQAKGLFLEEIEYDSNIYMSNSI